MKLNSKYIRVAGTNYEVGKAMGEICKASPQFLELSQIKEVTNSYKIVDSLPCS